MQQQTRIHLAGVLGNLIEVFDLVICGLLATYLAKYLVGNNSKGVILIFLSFFAGYLARPLGAIIMGILSDLYGRKIILAVSVLGMGIATSLIGLIPPAQLIHNYSIVILIILRIIQSLFSGAEYLNSAAYLVENAQPGQKTYAGGLASLGSMTGVLLASIVALIISILNNHYPELEWLLWRLPFLMTLAGCFIGLYIRISVPESTEFVLYATKHKKPEFINQFKEALRYINDHRITAIYAFMLSGLGVTSMYQIFVYAPNQARLYGLFSNNQIMCANIIALIVLLAVFPLIKALHERYSNERMVVIASVGFLLFAQPFFYYLSRDGYWTYMLMQCFIAIACGLLYANTPALLAELFPVKLRCSALSILYSIAASLSAGLTPLLSLILVNNTHNPAAPAVILMVLTGIVLLLIAYQNWEILSLDKQEELEHQDFKRRY